jgi:YidC/Oxa1 family membrane protein insertase
MNKDIQKAMMFGLPALSLAFTWWFPAGVQLSFVTASILSYTQVVAFQQPWFRSYFKMTPIAPVVRQTSSSYSYPGARPATSGPVLSQSELNSRFQGADQGQAKDQSLLAEAKQSFQGSVKLARDKMAKSNEDKERKRIEDYELKRQKEIKEEKERRRISKREKRRNV